MCAHGVVAAKWRSHIRNVADATSGSVADHVFETRGTAFAVYNTPWDERGRRRPAGPGARGDGRWVMGRSKFSKIRVSAAWTYSMRRPFIVSSFSTGVVRTAHADTRSRSDGVQHPHSHTSNNHIGVGRRFLSPQEACVPHARTHTRRRSPCWLAPSCSCRRSKRNTHRLRPGWLVWRNRFVARRAHDEQAAREISATI